MIDGFEPREESVTYAPGEIIYGGGASDLSVNRSVPKGTLWADEKPSTSVSPVSPLDEIAERIACATKELSLIHSNLTSALDRIDGGQPQDDRCNAVAPEPSGFIGVANDRLNNAFALIRRINDQADRLNAAA